MIRKAHDRVARILAGIVTAILIGGGIAELPTCETAECVTTDADRMTTSMLGEPDAPSAETAVDTTLPQIGGFGPSFVQLQPATLTLTPVEVVPVGMN